MAHIEIIYYLDVLSSWCHIADRALEQVETKYGESVRLDWRIAQLFDFGPLPYGREECEWYYARTARITGVQLNPAWVDSMQATTVYANQAAEASRALGAEGSHVRRGLSHAAVVEGKPLGRRDVALAEAVRLSGFPAAEIDRAMEESAVKHLIVQSTQEYKDLALPQLPSFVFRNTTGDLAVFSGLYTFESIDAVIGEMLHASRVTQEFGAQPV